MHFAVYSRKSVYTGKGESVENQIEMCKNYIFSKFDNVTDDDIIIYEDEGFSAKNTSRPQYQKMLNDMRNQKFKYIVCYRLDRISRNTSDFSALIEELNNKNISFICIKEEFDTSKPMGKAMMYIASVFAQLERETISERVQDNMIMLARNGQWLGGSTPIGFSYEETKQTSIDEKIKASHKLIQIPNEIEIVKTIYEKILELHSLSKVSKYLSSQGFKTRKNNNFTENSIRQILSNPVYCIADSDARNYFISKNSNVCFNEQDCSNKLGLMSYNKRSYKKSNIPRLSKDNWIIAIGKHNGIICGKKWIEVQNIIDSKSLYNSSKINYQNNYALLSGKIICKNCNKPMYSKYKGNNYYYICKNKLKEGKNICSIQNLNGLNTDNIVYKYITEYTINNCNLYKIFEVLKYNLTIKNKINEEIEIDKRIKKCNSEIDKLINLISNEFTEDIILNKLKLKIKALNNEIIELNNKKENLQNSKELPKFLIQGSLFSLKEILNNLSIYEKRNLIQLIVKKIEWNGADIKIYT